MSEPIKTVMQVLSRACGSLVPDDETAQRIGREYMSRYNIAVTHLREE